MSATHAIPSLWRWCFVAFVLFAVITPLPLIAGAISTGLGLPGELFDEPAALPAHLTRALDEPSMIFSANGVPGAHVNGGHWALSVLSRDDRLAHDAWLIGMSAGGTYRVGIMGWAGIRKHDASDLASPDIPIILSDEEDYGGGFTVGWHSEAGDALWMVGTVSQRHAEYWNTAGGESYAQGWSRPAIGLLIRTTVGIGSWDWSAVAKWQERSEPVGTVELVDMDDTSTLITGLRDEGSDHFVGLRGSISPHRQIRVHVGGWHAQYREPQAIVVSPNYRGPQVHQDVSGERVTAAAVGIEAHAANGLALRCGIQAGWSAPTAHEAWRFGQATREDTWYGGRAGDVREKSAVFFEDIRLGIGYSVAGLQIDAVVNERFNLLQPFEEVDVMIRW